MIAGISSRQSDIVGLFRRCSSLRSAPYFRWFLRIRHPRSQLAYYHAVLLLCFALPLIQPWQDSLASGGAILASVATAGCCAVVGHCRHVDPGAGIPREIVLAGNGFVAAPSLSQACNSAFADPGFDPGGKSDHRRRRIVLCVASTSRGRRHWGISIPSCCCQRLSNHWTQTHNAALPATNCCMSVERTGWRRWSKRFSVPSSGSIQAPGGCSLRPG